MKIRKIFSEINQLIPGCYIGDTCVPRFFTFSQHISEIAEEQQAKAATPNADAMSCGMAAVKLMLFWSNSPVAWVSAAGAQFHVHGVTNPLEKFYLVMTTLSEANVDRVKHIVEAKAHHESYQHLKEGLVASHMMPDYKK
jgi:hypothetical protein